MARPDAYIDLNGSVVRKLRNQLELSQEELAADANITRHTVANIETNRRGVRPHVARQIARVLGVPFERIKADDGD